MSEHRPFPPSSRRLALARRAGIHGASPHVTAAAAWIAFLVVAVAFGHAIAARLGDALAAACGARSESLGLDTLAPAILELALPLLAAAAIAAFVAHVAQTRALWLPRRRLDHAPQPPRDAGYRALAFAAAIGVVAFAWVWFAAPALAAGSAATLASAAASLVTTLVALAAIDALVRRVALRHALAMTHAERREDDRHAGADPRWRALRGRLGNDDAIASSVARAALIVLGDDVAVAIAWDPVREPVPRCTATGERARATQLLALGRRYQLPVHRDPALAAALAHATGRVPERYWAQLAEIVAATPEVLMPELIPQFLTHDEIATLRAYAARDGWKPGRQGTGYDTLPLRGIAELEALVTRGLARLGTPFEDYWDVYLIRYLDGSSIPPHTDAAQHGRRHRRINAVLEQAREGGELFVDGAKVELAVGDAVLFFPDHEIHEVTVVHGSRLLFSVGAWV